MKTFAICLFSVILLSTLIAKSSSTVIQTSKNTSSSKFIFFEKIEKVEIEEEQRLASDQLKKNEFVHYQYNHCFIEFSRPLLFTNVEAIIPSSYLERLERPPKKI